MDTIIEGIIARKFWIRVVILRLKLMFTRRWQLWARGCALRRVHRRARSPGNARWRQVALSRQGRAKAVENVNTTIADELFGWEVTDQKGIDWK